MKKFLILLYRKLNTFGQDSARAKRVPILIGALILIMSKNIWAEEKEAVELEPIVVTASRLEEPYSNVSRRMNVVTETEIAETNVRAVSEVLDKLPSINIVDYGSMGASKEVEIRGSSPEQVLVMIDGRPINDPPGGAKVNLSNLPIENIERIEVMRGPASSLYGSSAVGGVINIITKSAQEKPITTFTSKFGTFRTWREELTHGAQVDNFDYFLTTSFDKQEGYRDNSEYEAYNLTSKIGYQINQQNKLTLSSGSFESELGCPGTVSRPDIDDREEDFKNFIDFTWQKDIRDNSKLKLKAYQNCNRQEFTETLVPLDKDTHQTKTRGLDIQISLPLFDIEGVVLGINAQENLVNSSKFSEHKYNVKSIYLLNEFYVTEPLKLNWGGRIDDYSNFGTEFNPSISFLYKLNEETKFHGLVARSFRAPSFSELYWPATAMGTGNQNLKPEKGISGEVGIDKLFGDDATLGITYFRMDMDNLIKWVGAGYQATNIDSSIIEGVEIETEVHIKEGVSSEFNYTYLRAKDDNTDKYLTYKPKHKLNCSLKYEHPSRFMVRLDGEYVTERFTNTQNTDHIDDYFLMNLNLTKSIGKNSTYLLSINNLLDRQYQSRKGYPMPGFSVTSGCRFKF